MAQSTSPEDDQEQDEAASKDALYERATALKIKGRRKMNRDDLEAAVAAAEKELAANAPPPEDPPPDAPGTETIEPPKEATQEQARKIFAARTDQLEGLVADPKLAPHLRALVVQELGSRTEKARAAAAHQSAVGPVDRFKVVAGGRFITRDGFVTELPVGSVITPLTHDLDYVRKQGIQLEPARAVGVGYDQLGNQRSEVR